MLLSKLLSTKLIQVPVKANIIWDKKVASAPQFIVKTFLQPFWKFDQVVEEFYIPGSKLRLDLFNINKKIVVEISPDAYHTRFNKFLHRDNRHKFLAKVKADESKRVWCTRNDIRLIELYDEDIKALSKEYILEKYDISL